VSDLTLNPEEIGESLTKEAVENMRSEVSGERLLPEEVNELSDRTDRIAQEAEEFGHTYEQKLLNDPESDPQNIGVLKESLRKIDEEIEKLRSQLQLELQNENDLRNPMLEEGPVVSEIASDSTDSADTPKPSDSTQETAVEGGEEGFPEIWNESYSGWISEDLSPEALARLEQLMNEDPEVFQTIMGNEESRVRYENTFQEEYTPEEKQEAENGLKATVDRITQGGRLNRDSFEKLNSEAGSQEYLKLILRLAIKVSSAVAVAVARNLAKDKDTPYELRVALGTMADLIHGGEIFMEKLVSGQEHPNLSKDVRKVLFPGASSDGSGSVEDSIEIPDTQEV
jgi:hypothetical protein